jgi:hypothetical protein
MAIDMFLSLRDLKGEAQDKTHHGEIDIQSWSWGFSQPATTHLGSGGGSGKVQVQERKERDPGKGGDRKSRSPDATRDPPKLSDLGV